MFQKGNQGNLRKNGRVGVPGCGVFSKSVDYLWNDPEGRGRGYMMRLRAAPLLSLGTGEGAVLSWGAWPWVKGMGFFQENSSG